MSDRGIHLAAATASARLLGSLRQTEDHERRWIPTVAYYTAVQLVEARLALDNYHPEKAEYRHAAVVSASPPAGVPFRKLKQLSEYWRYRGWAPTDDEIAHATRWATDLAAAIDEAWPDTG